MEEIMAWLHEVREVFPKLNNKIILAEYKKMSNKKLGFVRAEIAKELNFDPEALLLGRPTKIKNKIIKPDEFSIAINKNLQNIENEALRKEIVQHIIVHELLHIEYNDFITLSKQYSRRKKKRIHTRDFENEILARYNFLREKRGIPKIEKGHLEKAVHKILDSINWHKK